jgi:hypothetical protein
VIKGINLGDKVTRLSEAMSGEKWSRASSRVYITGKVIWIHPQGRFFVMEATLPGGKVREAFDR